MRQKKNDESAIKRKCKIELSKTCTYLSKINFHLYILKFLQLVVIYKEEEISILSFVVKGLHTNIFIYSCFKVNNVCVMQGIKGKHSLFSFPHLKTF